MRFNKYYKEQQKVSHDNGVSWQWLDVYRKGGLLTTDNWDDKESCERGDEPTPETYPPYSILYTTNGLDTNKDFKINNENTGIFPRPNKINELVTFDIGDSLNSLRYFIGDNINITELKFVGEWDTSKVTDMSRCFTDNVNLKKLSGLENLDVSSAEDFYHTFSNTSLETIDISKWTFKRNAETNYMFSYSKVKRIYIDSYDPTGTDSDYYTYIFTDADNIEYIRLKRSLYGVFDHYKEAILPNFNSIQWDIVD